MAQRTSHRTLTMVVAVSLVLIAIGVTAFALMANPNKDTGTERSSTRVTDEATSPNPSRVSSTESNVGSTVIVFTDTGFDREMYTSKAGEAVTVRNDSGMDLQFSSDDHPAHQENPELNLTVLSAGESASFTPPGKGTYGFHDHINEEYTGLLTVE